MSLKREHRPGFLLQFFFLIRQADSLYRCAKDLLASLHRLTFIPCPQSRTDHRRRRIGENRTTIERGSPRCAGKCKSSRFYHGNQSRLHSRYFATSRAPLLVIRLIKTERQFQLPRLILYSSSRMTIQWMLAELSSFVKDADL